MPSLASPFRLASALALAALLLTTSGCGLMAHMVYWIKGDKIDARFPGLAGKRVAVVCVSANSLGNGESDAVAHAVSSILRQQLKEADIVRQDEIADWMDRNDWDQIDFRDVGRGVKADMVLGIDLERFTTNDGATLLKGRSTVSLKVFDMQQDGKLVYDPPPTDINFPENGARHVTENPSAFRRVFIHTVAQNIARNFYAYDRLEDYANDATYLGD